MPILRSIVQIIVALGLLNVWLLHFRQRTAYRGGNAGSMKDEFIVYGMPEWSVYVVGALKVGIAICLLAGLWLPAVVFPASLLLCVLMVGALADARQGSRPHEEIAARPCHARLQHFSRPHARAREVIL